MTEAFFYKKREGDRVQCGLCHHRCLIPEGKKGFCGVMENQGGILYNLVYGKIIARHVDPIEKKPLFNFFPGSSAFSIATVGCNFRCFHCQNAEISQMPRKYRKIPGEEYTPENVVSLAKSSRCQSIAYTYTEPTIFFEFAYEIARLAYQEGIKNIFITNGYMSEEALEKIKPFLDGANVDLKSFREEFYHKVCGAKLKPVLENLRRMKKMGIWVEVTTLVIPTLNDSEEEFRNIAQFIRSLGEETPWHISAFYPAYKALQYPPTPAETLRNARRIGREEGLRYVYCGNVPGDEGENTYCYRCGELVLGRYGYTITSRHIREGKCAHCGTPIDGVGM